MHGTSRFHRSMTALNLELSCQTAWAIVIDENDNVSQIYSKFSQPNQKFRYEGHRVESF